MKQPYQDCLEHYCMKCGKRWKHENITHCSGVGLFAKCDVCKTGKEENPTRY